MQMPETNPAIGGYEANLPAAMHTVLRSLPAVALPDLGGYTDPAGVKKQIRQEISLQHTTDRLGFMHGALIAVEDRTYVLAGCSGVGKSTYANELGDLAGAETLANDWVAIEREDEEFFVSGLDWPGSLKQRERQRLSGVIFLTGDDEHERDAFVPNTSEYRRLVGDAFDTATTAEADRLHKFWAANKDDLPFVAAVPVRRASQTQTAHTLADVIRRSVPQEQTEVGVIGVGAVGTALAFRLGQLASVSRVHLFSPSVDRVTGTALDMNQAAGREVFVPHRSAEDVLAAASSTFLSYRIPAAPASAECAGRPERWQKLMPHLAVMRDVARAAADRPGGTLFTITNPVDALTYAAYRYGRQGEFPARTYQQYGIGLGVDVSRAKYYAEQLGIPLDGETMRVYGSHSDAVVFETSLDMADNARLVEAVHRASEAVRSHGPRTIYAPVSAAVQAFEAYAAGGDAYVTAVQDGAYMGRRIRFRHGLPLLPEETFSPAYEQVVASHRGQAEALRELMGEAA